MFDRSNRLNIAAVTSVASSASNVTLLASDYKRKAFTITNDSTAVLYIKFGATASSTSFSFKMAAGAEKTFDNDKVWQGQVDGIWAAANGSARITSMS